MIAKFSWMDIILIKKYTAFQENVKNFQLIFLSKRKSTLQLVNTSKKLHLMKETGVCETREEISPKCSNPEN